MVNKRDRMKILKITVPAIGIILSVVGCKPSSESSYSSMEATNNPPIASRENTNTLSPTSRDTNFSTSRIYSQDTNSSAPKQPDNTGINVRDRSDTNLTAGDQPENESDRKITQAVRKTIMANDQLSAEAKNIKIITVNGKVTLRGPVKTEEEKKAVESAVQGLGGVSGVDNQLEVKTSAQ
jgi:hypothetical protein